MAGVAVLGLHLLLVWLVVAASGTRTTRAVDASEPRRLTIRLLLLSEPATAGVPAPGIAPAVVAPPSDNRRRTPIERRWQVPRRPATAATSGAPKAVTASGIGTPAGLPAAGASEPQPSLLDTNARRRAVRASARDTGSPAHQAALAGDVPAPVSEQQRLGTAIRSTAHGDCWKGEYAGAGIGLLSVPFLAAAAARGKCAQ